MRRQPMSGLYATIGAALLLGASATVAAAQTATITGRVTAADAGAQPIVEARVYVVGTNLVTATNPDGRFTLRSVPAGTREVRVIRVGFQEQKKPVTVPPGGTVTVDFSLQPSVVTLQEVVTTATGEQRREEVPALVSSISNVAQRVAETPITNVSDLLVGKAPGATVLPGSMTGTAGTIRLRGINSITLGNSPIWIVDGVRFNAGSVGVNTGGQSTTLLNSLNPEDIESVEIVKGPAAAALYGTDAANGVLVVTTKRGQAGDAQWNVYTEQGIIEDKGDYPDSYMIWGRAPATATVPNPPVRRCELTQISAGSCIADSVTSFNPLFVDELTPLQTGYRSQYGAQVGGGSAQLRYFISGEYEQETGPLTMPDVDVARFNERGIAIRDEWMNPERLNRISIRSNLNSAVNDKLDLSVQSTYVRTNQRLAQTDNNLYSIFYQTMMNPGFRGTGPGRPTGLDPLGQALNGNNNFTIGDIFQRLVSQDIHRFIGAVNSNWRPLSWLTADATVGIDLANRRDFNLCRFGECMPAGQFRLGTVSNSNNNNRNLSARFTATGTWQPTDVINLNTTLGADYTNIGFEGSSSSGQRLPPGAQTVGSAAITSGGGNLPTATKTLGYVLQQRVSFNDRLFLTASARSDQNSAFGVNYGNAIYPSAGLSWVASAEPFFPAVPGVSYLRFRAAYGQAGVNPGATAALFTYSAPTVNIEGTDTPGLTASQIGNPQLKPEVSTEFETGFDARFLADRVSMDFTYYQKKTRDALLNQAIAASSGASDLSVLRNIGSVQNQGIELSLTAQLVDRTNVGWDVTIAGSRNVNEILSLGIDPSTGEPDLGNGTGTVRDSVGFPVGGYFFRPYSYTDANSDRIITADEVTVVDEYQWVGSSTPRNTFSLSSAVELFDRRLRVYGLLDYKGDFFVTNTNGSFLCTNNPASRDRSNPDTPLDDQAACVATRLKNPSTTRGYLDKGDFLRLREVSLTYNLPATLTNAIRAGGASLSLGGRNLALWTNYGGADPEQNYSTGDIQSNIASSSPRTYYTLRLNLNY